jgi:hypothetical protein
MARRLALGALPGKLHDPLPLAAAMIAVAWLAGCGGASATRTPAPPAITWERVDPVPGSRDGPGRIVDTGELLIGAGPGGPWVSDDGRAWARGEVDGPAGASIASVAAGPVGGPAFVGVGSAGGEAANRPIAFTSTDGQRWTAVASQPGFDLSPGYGQAHLDLVVSGTAAMVAAGTEWGIAGQRPFVLVSADGLRWERTAEPLVGSGPRGLVATDRGFVMAGAADAPAGQMTHAAFWISEDGRTWQTAPDIAAFPNAEPQALAIGNGVIVAVGYRIAAPGLAPAAWTSSDGRIWLAAAETPALASWPAGRPTPAQGAMGGTAMWGVASLSSGFIAVGTRFGINPAAAPSPEGQSRIIAQGVVWRSADGVTWEVLPDDPVLPLGTSEGTMGTGMYSVVARDGEVIAIGGTQADGGLVFAGTLARSPAP